ncbi:MAG: DmsE family decaheme c-type cytochrome [Bryobacteraceae bacterium]|nr:DmsE family decaheme c-type cytochrome [Bryobacteraceae bacterium]
MLKSAVAALVLLFVAIVSPSSAAQTAAPTQPVPEASKSEYVGGNVCRTCHPNVWVNFYKNPHYKSVAAGNLAPGNTGCEGCHGPAKAHVAARGGKATIVAFSELRPKQILDACLRCHSKDFSRSEIRRSSHTQNDVACTACHSIHQSQSQKQLLAKRQADLCYSCHAPVRAQFNMPFKHRVNEGVIQCSDCHNPHGTPAPTWRMSARPRMVEHAQGNEEACLKCHIDLRGPFVYEHAAVRVDGCESCHNPHGSTNAKLLKRPVVYTLCLECHNGAGNFGRSGDGIPTQSPSHNMADPRFRNCTTCHVRIHGSNADARFLR